MYACRQEGCVESIAPAHPTYPRHHLNSHHVNHTHRYDPRRCSMHAGAIAKSLFVVASLPLDLRRARSERSHIHIHIQIRAMPVRTNQHYWETMD